MEFEKANIFNIALHVIILFTFLTLFFTFYITTLSKDVFKHHIDVIVDGNITDALNNTSTQNKTILKGILSQVPLDKYIKLANKETDVITVHNKWLLGTTFAVIITSVIGISLITMLPTMKKLPLHPILVENMISFIFIGLIEYLFFTNIAFKFIPVSPTLLESTMISTIKS